MRMPNTTTAYLSGGTVTRYIASASYTGTSKHTTGYTVTAHYTGEVDKTGCNMVTYTAYPNRNRDMYFENHKAPTIEIIKKNSIVHDRLPNVRFQVWYTSNARELLEYADMGKRKGKIRITNLAEEQISLPKKTADVI